MSVEQHNKGLLRCHINVLFSHYIFFTFVLQASAYVAQVYDAVLAYAHALTRLHEAGTIDTVREPSLDIVHCDGGRA